MRRLALVTLITLTLGACSDDPPAAPGTPGGTEQITGNERIGWSQQAASAADLAGLGYNLYVDSSNARIVKAMRDALVAGNPTLASQLASTYSFGITSNGPPR